MDIDELLVPHADMGGTTSPSYSQLLDHLDALHPNAAVLRFWNVFFPQDFSPDPGSGPLLSPSTGAELEVGFTLLGERLTQRLSPTPEAGRSKCIYKPHRVAQVFTHLGAPLNRSYSVVSVDPLLACNHHYRRNSPPGGYHSSQRFTDTTLRDRYAKKIRQTEVFRRLSDLYGNS